jgi:glycosidase
MPFGLQGRVKETTFTAFPEAPQGLRSGELFQHSEAIRYPVIRTLNTYPRLHGRKVKDIPDSELASWTKGVDVLWVMGLQKRSPAAVAHAHAWEFQYEPVIGVIRRGDVVGSAFATHAFLPDSALVEKSSNWDEVKELRKKLHKSGKKLYGDIVFHGVAPDHEWITEHPTWFICATEEQFQKHPGDFFTITAKDGNTYHIAKGRSSWGDIAWADLAQLNLAHPQTQQALIEVAKIYGKVFDGGRIDMAMLLTPYMFEDIWGEFLTADQKRLLDQQKKDYRISLLSQIIGAAKQFAREDGRTYTTIAETYSHFGQDDKLLQSVDHIYEKGWYDDFLNVIRAGASLPELAKNLNRNMGNMRWGVLFTGNHDEVPPVREFRYRKVGEKVSWEGKKEGIWEMKDHAVGRESSLAASAIMSLLPTGAFLLDDTQQEGYDGQRVPMQVGRLPDFQKDERVTKFYDGLLALKHTKLVQTARYSIAPTKYKEGQQEFDLDHPAILPLHMQSQDEKEGMIVCSNFSQNRQGCVLPITGEVDIEVFDLTQGKWLSPEIIDRNRNGGFLVVLNGYQVQAVHYKKRMA